MAMGPTVVKCPVGKRNTGPGCRKKCKLEKDWYGW